MALSMGCSSCHGCEYTITGAVCPCVAMRDAISPAWSIPPMPLPQQPHMPLPPMPASPAPKISEGRKDDGDKPRVDLLDPLALEGLSAVLTFGAKKYASHNWRGGISYSRLLAALLRHTFAVMRGEDLDPESGLPHIDHVGCCWMFISAHMKYDYLKKMDDRWKPPSAS